MNQSSSSRGGFTLIELLLSLALIVVATALIGSLMQLYSRNFASRGDDIRREQLARSLLGMIADDVRSVVLEHEYDPTVLEQMLSSSSGGGGDAGGGGDSAGGAPTGGTGFSAGDSSLASDSSAASDTSVDTESLDETATTEMPMGLYGNQSTLMVDMSRVPRTDEYAPQQNSIVSGNLVDVPGDLKTVTYFIQVPTNQGVDDVMSNFTQAQDSAGFSSGLIRRSLDRRVTAYAEEIGDTDRLTRTGDLVAPEVVSLEFGYYDGTQWLYEWDSSTQGLPWLISVTLAMQSAEGRETNEVAAGTLLSAMSIADREAYGIDIYQLTVAIPGAQLHAGDTSTEDDAGLEAMGL